MYWLKKEECPQTESRSNNSDSCQDPRIIGTSQLFCHGRDQENHQSAEDCRKYPYCKKRIPEDILDCPRHPAYHWRYSSIAECRVLAKGKVKKFIPVIFQIRRKENVNKNVYYCNCSYNYEQIFVF